MERLLDDNQIEQDVRQALQRMMNNSAIYQRLLTMFFDSFPIQLNQLRNLWQANDRTKCVNILHKLGSGAKSVAADMLGEELKSLEKILADEQQELPDVSVLLTIEGLATESHKAIAKAVKKL